LPAEARFSHFSPAPRENLRRAKRQPIASRFFVAFHQKID